METRVLTCIGCPLGCTLTAVPTENGFDVTGYTCKRGLEYAQKELTRTVERAQKAGLRLTAAEDAAGWLAQECAKGRGGARDLRRKIRSEIETPAARRLLISKGELQLKAVVENGRLSLVETG